jgi:DNA adenine methylase
MILNRLGNKEKLAGKIIRHFPKHDIYMEPFFGSGSIFFSKPKVKYNFLNDLDDDVYNLFRQLVDNKEELVHWLERVPITHTQFVEWGKGKREKTDVLNAVRFLIISNYGLYGKPDTMRTGAVNPRKQILEQINFTHLYLSDAQFLHCDFRVFFNRVDYKTNKKKSFVYVDPPYLATGSNYSDNFTEQDSLDLFEALENSGVKWAMSEFNSPFILKQAEKRNLHVLRIGERKNLKNKRIEILVTNYKNTKTFFNLND